MIRSSFTDEEGLELIYNDDSDCELEEKIEVNLGDYAIVLVAGKSRSLKFIARIDNYDRDDCEYKGVFLQKVKSKIDSGMGGDKGQTFIVNEKDAASFAPDDIVLILSAPVAVGGSERRSNQLRFNFGFSKLDLA